MDITTAIKATIVRVVAAAAVVVRINTITVILAKAMAATRVQEAIRTMEAKGTVDIKVDTRVGTEIKIEEVDIKVAIRPVVLKVDRLHKAETIARILIIRTAEEPEINGIKVVKVEAEAVLLAMEIIAAVADPVIVINEIQSLLLFI